MQQKSQPQKSKSSSFFQKLGPRVPVKRIYEELERVGSFPPYVEEFIKEKLKTKDYPTSPHITEKELRDILNELEKNPKDPVSKDIARRIRKRFGL
jgi:hypothetical protein